MFLQQYSKIGITREQLFHAWRSFHYDENTERIDAYVTCIRQVATHLGYGESQPFRGIQKHTPYNIVLGIIFHRQVVERVKRILTKGKIGRQLPGHSLSTPFMSLKDSCDKRVTFNIQDGREDKTDRLGNDR